MAFARTRALRSLHNSLRRAAPRASGPARTQLVQRRWASGGGHGAAQEGSDMPWLIGAVAITIPSCWYLWPDTSHAEHHAPHGENDEETNQEGGEDGGEAEGKQQEGGEEEGGDEKEDKGDDKQDQGEDKPEGGDDSKKGDDDEKDEKAGQTSGGRGDIDKPNNEQEKDDKESGNSDTFDDRPEGGERDVPKNSEEGGDDQETKPGGGGGKDDMTRVEVPTHDRKIKKKPGYGQPIGQSNDDDDNTAPDRDPEAPPPSKPDQKGKYGETTGKQFGVSTSDTKHSLPIDSDPGKSKKAEGYADTAKAKGTVDPGRPVK